MTFGVRFRLCRGSNTVHTARTSSGGISLGTTESAVSLQEQRPGAERSTDAEDLDAGAQTESLPPAIVNCYVVVEG